jgi:branched-subunit amino acid transport protein
MIGLRKGELSREEKAPVDLKSVNQRLHARSTTLLLSLENRLENILIGWLLVGGLVCAARIAVSPLPHGTPAALAGVAPYMLVITAPFISTMLALRWFRNGDELPQPATRLAVVGSWRSVSKAEARTHALYGTTGIMVSLLVGIMLNVPVRALEYFVAMPPVGPAAPRWLSTLNFAMTLDVVLFGSLYMIAFVAALRRVPLFPRLLFAIWLGDLLMQLVTARMATDAPHLPAGVAAALHALLEGNVKKVLISAAIWLPYLLLSKRVNVTYRNRVPA